MQNIFFKKTKFAISCCCIVFASALLAQPAQIDSIFYDLSSPDKVIELDYELHEISGLSLTPDSTKLCAVQDESGVLYFLNKTDGKIEKKVSFRFSGDFEGVEFVDSVAFAIKSNGDIFRIQNWDSEEPIIDSFPTSLSKKDDIEGLGYLPSLRMLLLAAKGDPSKSYSRAIYAFSIDSMTLIEQPFLEIDPLEVECILGKKQDEDEDCFSPSAIALHPITDEIYLLSAARKRFVILDKAGKMLYAEKINKKIMPQPEGICFDPDGTMYISSEGKKGNKGTILIFKPHRFE